MKGMQDVLNDLAVPALVAGLVLEPVAYFAGFTALTWVGLFLFAFGALRGR